MLKNCRTGRIRGDSARNGHIALAPNNAITNKLKALLDVTTYTSQYYTDLDALKNYMTSPDYKEDVCIGIVAEEISTDKY